MIDWGAGRALPTSPELWFTARNREGPFLCLSKLQWPKIILNTTHPHTTE